MRNQIANLMLHAHMPRYERKAAYHLWGYMIWNEKGSARNAHVSLQRAGAMLPTPAATRQPDTIFGDMQEATHYSVRASLSVVLLSFFFAKKNKKKNSG
jgi:hypothetical protein